LNRDLSTGPSLFHSINLTGLESNQTYYITLHCSDNNGNISELERTFATLRQQKIAYISLINGRDQIYCMNADGSNQVRLSDGNNRDFSPVWSPDGNKMAFVSTRDGDLRLYIMNADGSGQARLTNGNYKEFTPSWSPDGKNIAFISIMDEYDRFRINILNIDSGQVTQLGIHMTQLVEKLTGDYEPAWSPDGKKIAYMSSGYDLCDQIFVVNADGGDPVQLSDGYNYEGEPAWSPDSKKIVYCQYSTGNSQIYVMNEDGTNQTRLTQGSDHYPAWSPDNKKIAFSSNRDANHQIYVMNADGSNQTQLTHGSYDSIRPVWSP
jgi:TolB protein